MPEPLVALEGEPRRERGHRPVHPIPQEPPAQDRLPQLDEVVRARDHQQQPAIVAEHPAELGRVPPRGDGRHRAERRVGIGQRAVGVGHDEVKAGVPRGRRLDGGHGEIHPVALAPEALREGAHVVALAAADLEQRISRGEGQ